MDNTWIFRDVVKALEQFVRVVDTDKDLRNSDKLNLPMMDAQLALAALWLL